MTKEITKANILQEIEDKFKLRELIPEKFRFEEGVIPVYNIEQHLERWDIGYTEKSVTTGPHSYLMFTVPYNEKWKVRGYNVIFMAAGAYTVTGVYVSRVVGGSMFVYLDMTAGQSVSYAVNLPTPLELYPGDKISIYVDSYTSTAALRLYMDHMIEAIR